MNATLTNAPPVLLVGLKPPVELPDPWAWLWWTLGGIAATATLVAAGVWIYRKATRPPLPELPLVRARRQLREVRALLGDPAAFCAVLSSVIRVYLEGRLAMRAAGQTTEEFLAAMEASPQFSAAQSIAMTQFLRQCDLVKFAQDRPAREVLEGLHGTAARLVEETAPKPTDGARPAP